VEGEGVDPRPAPRLRLNDGRCLGYSTHLQEGGMKMFIRKLCRRFMYIHFTLGWSNFAIFKNIAVFTNFLVPNKIKESFYKNAFFIC
jgi:hypothetical protein